MYLLATATKVLLCVSNALQKKEAITENRSQAGVWKETAEGKAKSLEVLVWEGRRQREERRHHEVSAAGKD